mgnify:CR=1 FL=1
MAIIMIVSVMPFVGTGYGTVCRYMANGLGALGHTVFVHGYQWNGYMVDFGNFIMLPGHPEKKTCLLYTSPSPRD